MINAIASRLRLLVSLCVVISVIHIVNVFMSHQLSQYGIVPRNLDSLPFIFIAPLLHADMNHLANNLIALCIFSSLCLLRSIRFYILSSLFIIAVTGLLVWFFARTALHIGASGWIFGLWSLSIAIAWFEKNFLNISISLFVIIFYGGMVYGILPSGSHISFESHIFGAISGILCAFFASRFKSTESKL